MLKYLLKLLMLMIVLVQRQARCAPNCVVVAQAEVDLVDQRHAAARATPRRGCRRKSSGWIEVPVGLEGEASSTPRVRAVQCVARPCPR
jgi:hypothetical protein